MVIKKIEKGEEISYTYDVLNRLSIVIGGNVTTYNYDKVASPSSFGGMSKVDASGYQNYWNQGLLTEALKVLTEFSFEQFGLKKLILLIDKENVPSKKVALKSGYHLVKKFKGTNQYSKKIRDFEQYELGKSDDEIYQKNSEIGEI